MKALKEKRLSLRSVIRGGLVILSLLALVFVACNTSEEPVEPPEETSPVQTSPVTPPPVTPVEPTITAKTISVRGASTNGDQHQGYEPDLAGLTVEVRWSDDTYETFTTLAALKGKDLAISPSRLDKYGEGEAAGTFEIVDTKSATKSNKFIMKGVIPAEEGKLGVSGDPIKWYADARPDFTGITFTYNSNYWSIYDTMAGTNANNQYLATGANGKSVFDASTPSKYVKYEPKLAVYPTDVLDFLKETVPYAVPGLPETTNPLPGQLKYKDNWFDGKVSGGKDYPYVLEYGKTVDPVTNIRTVKVGIGQGAYQGTDPAWPTDPNKFKYSAYADVKIEYIKIDSIEVKDPKGFYKTADKTNFAKYAFVGTPGRPYGTDDVNWKGDKDTGKWTPAIIPNINSNKILLEELKTLNIEFTVNYAGGYNRTMNFKEFVDNVQYVLTLTRDTTKVEDVIFRAGENRLEQFNQETGMWTLRLNYITALYGGPETETYSGYVDFDVPVYLLERVDLKYATGREKARVTTSYIKNTNITLGLSSGSNTPAATYFEANDWLETDGVASHTREAQGIALFNNIKEVWVLTGYYNNGTVSYPIEFEPRMFYTDGNASNETVRNRRVNLTGEDLQDKISDWLADNTGRASGLAKGESLWQNDWVLPLTYTLTIGDWDFEYTIEDDSNGDDPVKVDLYIEGLIDNKNKMR